jgi:hypothetical protein
MRIADHLSKEQKQQLEKIKSPKKKHPSTNATPKKKEEKVNWHEIMGTNRDIYKRKNGALRRK